MLDENKISKEMKEQGRWCVWKYDEKKSKLPFNPKTGRMIKANRKETFADFETACDCYKRGGYEGLGMGIFDGFCAIDIDHCIDDANHPSDMAREIIREMNSYTEISPSGKGIRIIFKIKNYQYDKEKYYIMNHKLGLEIYVSGVCPKYVTITGDALDGHDVRMAEESLQTVLDRYMHRDVPVIEALQPEDSEDAFHYLTIGLKKDKKLISYWHGNRNADKSESENDLAFMSKLMYWCNNDSAKAVQVFLASPYVEQKDESHKKKLERKDYLQSTVRAAVCRRTAAKDNEQYMAQKQSQTKTKERKNAMDDKKYLPLISATELRRMELPPMKFFVEDLLPEGISIIVAAPKSGKSWFVLDMGLSIAAGREFLGKQTKPDGVLYLALEDSERRLQDRMNKVLGKTEPPSNFYVLTEAPTLDNGELLQALEAYIKKYNIKLVIIDTLQKIRKQECSQGSSYQKDYKEMGEIKHFADTHNLSIVLVHHTRKMKDDDVFNMISGTNGIMGAADTAFVIHKNKRKDKNAVLNVVGRDVEQADLAISFDETCFRWKMEEVINDMRIYEEKARYNKNPLVRIISCLLGQSDKGEWKGEVKEIKQKGEELGIILLHTSHEIIEELEELSDLLLRYDNIYFKTHRNGNANKKCHFRRCLPDYTLKGVTPDKKIIDMEV